MENLIKYKIKNINQYFKKYLFYRKMKLFIKEERFKKQINRSIPVIIFQMGKVGSISIKQSLIDYGLPIVLHTHNLSDNNEDNEMSFINNCIIKRKHPSKFISLVREPIGRNISAFFENFKRETGIGFEDSRFTLEQLSTIFLENYPHDKPLIWFEKYLKPVLGIDVYQYPFIKEDGVSAFRKGNFELIILKSEIDNRIKEKKLSEFLEIGSFKIYDRNIGSKKIYSEVYKNFKRNIKLPSAYIEKMLNSKYTQHFYTDKEIRDIAANWSRQ